MTLGERICHFRTEKHLSQGDLADRLGVSRQSVSKWETSGSVPDLDNLVKLSEIFGVTLDELVKGEKPQVQTMVMAAPPPRDGRIIVGVILLCMGALAALLLIFLAGDIAASLAALPFLLCGAVCMLCRRHVGLWCTWAVIFLADFYLRYATAISWRYIFLTPVFEPEMNYIRLAIGWGQFLVITLLVVVTVHRFSRGEDLPGKITPKVLMLFWAGFLTLEGVLAWVYRQWWMSRLLPGLLDWCGLALLAALLSITIRFFRVQKKNTP